jgi:indoleamine 2,3-dioxygenase
VFEEMREYMPRSHRAFLEAIAKLPDLGAFVKGNRMHEKLVEAYNGVLSELAKWRSKHIGVVTTHIVNQARKDAKEKVAAEEVRDGLSVKDESELQGTGGTALIPFLRGARQDTEAAKY